MAKGLIVPPSVANDIKPDDALFEVLSTAKQEGANGYMSLPFGILTPPAMQNALIEATKNEWLRLIDINMVRNPHPQASSNPALAMMPARVFKLTRAGEARLSMLEAQRAPKQ